MRRRSVPPARFLHARSYAGPGWAFSTDEPARAVGSVCVCVLLVSFLSLSFGASGIPA